ncbi:MAG: TolC family protein [Deltaproteobacteria bacterium]|nr:TolC family protein [Deltaproteobacteria bacterium]
MKRAVFSASLSGLLLLSGCALIQPTRPAPFATAPPLVASRASAPGPRAALPDAPLKLEQALAIALSNNPDLLGAGWDVEAARALARQASAGHWPSLEVQASYRHHWHEERLVPARGQPSTGSFSHDIFSGDVILRIPILAGGSVTSAVAASELLARAAEKRLARTREELVFDVKSAFYAILGQQALIQASEHSRKALVEHLCRTEQLIEARKAARVDRLNIEVRLAEIDHRLVEQRGALELHQRLLSSLLGIQDAQRDLALEGSLSPAPSPPDRDELLAAALEARADIAELKLEIEAQARRVDVIRAEYWPVVSAKGTYGPRLSAQGDYDDLGFAGIELSMPLFSGFSTPARIDEEHAKLRSLQAREQKLVLAVRRELDSALIRFETARAALAATEKSIAMAEESLRIAREKAALGHGTAMDVLDAQAALLQAETRYSAALADLHTTHALLELAAGGRS